MERLVTNQALKFAQFFATTKHAGQIYSGSLPYTHHLAAVEQVVRRFGLAGDNWGCVSVNDETMLVAAWLHDVVEDTDTKIKEVRELFGDKVGDLVEAVTNEDGPNRKVRHALTYPKTRAAGRLAVRLKLADRIANVEAGGKLVKMYREEHEDFERALYTAGENEDMWMHLRKILGGG